MKTLNLIYLTLLVIGAGSVWGVTLQEVYESASPGMGYDKVLYLETGGIYTGGLTMTNSLISIRGNGAVIDLQGGRISISGESRLDVDGCIIINGSDGIYATGTVHSRITQCTFYGNQTGIHFMSENGSIEVVNTILTHQSQYGFACEEETLKILHYLNAYQNLQGDYVEWCST